MPVGQIEGGIPSMRSSRGASSRTALTRHRPYDRPQVPTAAARLRDQESPSVSARRYFRTQALPSGRRLWSIRDAVDLRAVIAGFADDLCKLPFPIA